jgi:micrococcal nuclease
MDIESTIGWITIAAMRLAFPVLALSLAGLLGAADKISTSAAKDHLNQTATVCGKVVGTRYLDQSANKFTFLNFDKTYPDSPFTAVIPGENHAKFGEPEKTYLEKNICVTGKIVEYNKKPEIIVTEPSQIKVEGK